MNFLVSIKEIYFLCSSPQFLQCSIKHLRCKAFINKLNCISNVHIGQSNVNIGILVCHPKKWSPGVVEKLGIATG